MVDIKEHWRAGHTTLNGWLMTPSPFTAEIMARSGFDTVTLDMQHGLHDYASALACVQAMQVCGIPIFARVAGNDASAIGKLLDLGIAGIICPMINSAEDASRLVAACRYPPMGERSFGPTRALLYDKPAGYVERANKDVAVFAMIETRQAVENVADIVGCPGIDGIYIGPSDLGLSLGLGIGLDRQDAEVLRAFEQALNASSSAGKFAGVHTGSASYARRMLGMGFDFTTLPSDASMLQATARALISETRTLD